MLPQGNPQKIKALVFFATLLFISLKTNAYPNFIGYGYSACITCHYNNHGNGPLNDYGRALFSQEIAARPFVSSSTSDEELAQKSGFIPGKELPWWIRPGIKYRGLWMRTNPGGGGETSKDRYIEMQREFNLALHFDRDQKFVGVVTWSMLPQPADIYQRGTEVKSYYREQYLRYQPTEKLFLIAGLTDKVYGIRNIDHSAFSRGTIGFNQYSQTHGLTGQLVEDNWDISLQVHAGNFYEKPEIQQKGFSATSEYSLAEKHRLGWSVLKTQSEIKEMSRFAIHDRWGLTHSPRSSVMWEIGIHQDKTKATDLSTTGSYAMGELMLNFSRGYNLLSTIERYQKEMKSSSPELFRWSMGALLFPMQRTELRLMIINGKDYTPDASSPDSWAAQGQIHVSL